MRVCLSKILTVIVLVLGIVWIIVGADNHSLQTKYLKDNGYVSLKEIMMACGYQEISDNQFTKEVCGVDISVNISEAEKALYKNDYRFDFTDGIMRVGNQVYVSLDKMENVVNVTYDGTNAKDIDYTSNDWWDISRIVAHAGGAIRERYQVGYYTNSYDALIQNYNLGHRVMEFDFYLTSDKKLACVHDWEQFGDCDGRAYSAEEWLASRTIGSPATKSRYTTMMIDDLLDEMVVNPDLFIVTDTKSTEFADEEGKLEFELIKEAAMKRDPKLLDRIIVQIYNEEMYDYVMDVYPFKNIIYTLYATKSSAEEVLQFVEKHDNIGVITHPLKDERFVASDYDSIHAMGKKIFVHTVNTYADMVSCMSKGRDGVYSDLLTPYDYSLFIKYNEDRYDEEGEQK